MMNSYDKGQMSMTDHVITAAAAMTWLLAMLTSPANANDTIAMEPTPWGVYMETEAGNDQQYMPPEYVKAEVDAQTVYAGLRGDAFPRCYQGVMAGAGYPDAPVLYEGFDVGE